MPVNILRKIPLRLAWYGFILLAALLPAIVVAPWLAGQAHNLLLSRAMLSEKMFHNELETRIDLETERLISVLKNKSDPIAYFMTHGDKSNFIQKLIVKIDKREAMVNSTSIYDTHAKLLYSTHKHGHTIPEIRADIPSFIIPLHQRVFISSPLRLADGHFEFLIAVPITLAGESVGVMVSSVNINDFWQGIRKRLPAHGSRVYLVDGRGSLLIHQLGSQYKQGDLLSKHAIVRTLLAHKDWNKTDVYKGFENSDVFGIGTAVPGLGWGIISEIPEGKITAPIVSALTMLIAVIVLLYLALAALGIFFTRRLLRPISALVEAMQKVAKGDYQHAVIKPSLYQEIDDLGTSFKTMIHEIEVREDSLRKQTHIMEQLGESLIITNQHGVIEYVNPAFTRITGYEKSEVVGHFPKIVNSGTQPKAFYTQMWTTILAGHAWEGRLINRKKDGTLYPTMMSIVPVYHNNEITNFIAVQQDMSEQVMLEEKLQQSQKMEALGTLVGGIAHDFNNILAGITGNLYLLKKMTKASPDVTKKLENIESLSFRSADMIKQLLTFARQDTVRMAHMHVDLCVREVLRFLKPAIPENIIIHEDICSDELVIKGDESKLHQVLMNLMSNARDALKHVDNPVINIRLSHFRADGVFMSKHNNPKSVEYAHISVADNGMGIAKEHIEYLFDPFYTTKEQGKGTGLGLSMVFGAMETHQGFVEVESKEGKGSTFHIYIPLLESSEMIAAPEESEPEPVKNSSGGIILLVDDELQVRKTTAEVLESMGYSVLQASDGVKAMDVFKSHQHECSLVILDVVMPHCGGVEAAIGIRKINPDIPIIFVSGYDREKMLGDCQISNSQALSKPINLNEMAGIIYQMLA